MKSNDYHEYPFIPLLGDKVKAVCQGCEHRWGQVCNAPCLLIIPKMNKGIPVTYFSQKKNLSNH